MLDRPWIGGVKALPALRSKRDTFGPFTDGKQGDLKTTQIYLHHVEGKTEVMALFNMFLHTLIQITSAPGVVMERDIESFFLGRLFDIMF